MPPDNEFDSLDVEIFEFDPVVEVDVEETSEGRIAIIRTTDRSTYRRCRRKWGWSSHLRGNLEKRTKPSPFWTGSGFHFALEDFHGEKKYENIVDAFYAYTEATKRYDKKNLPGDWQEQRELAVGMLQYYQDEWLPQRDPFKTFIHNGIPQTEVNFRIDLPWEPGKFGYDKVVYSGTIDRVIIDANGLLWLVEYKTAKIIQTLHLENDFQVSAYVWAGTHLYPGYQVAGVVYQQHRKVVPHDPAWTHSGFSCDKKQLTTPKRYRDSLIKTYGSVENSPGKNIDFLNSLTTAEDGDWSKYVRRDWSERNEHQCRAEGVKILLELDEMLNPDLPLYPNPTRDCHYLCDFVGPCVSIDDGGDWEYELDALMKTKDRSYDSWRKYLPSQTELQVLLEQQAQVNQPLTDLFQ